MIHIDHSLLNNPASPAPPAPEPAVPILASHLLELEEKQRKRFTRDGRSERLSTGCREVDEVLGGGVERSVVMGISAAVEGREGRLLSLHLLASTLLPHLARPSTTRYPPPKTKATIIDTTGSFPLALLASVLKSRLLEAQSLSSQNAVKTGNHAVQDPTTSMGNLGKSEDNRVRIDEWVQQCLEMVAISRVFDCEGLWEVIGEVDQVDSTSGTVLDDQNENQKGALDVRDEGRMAAEQDIGANEPEIADSEEDTTPPPGIPPEVSKDRGEGAIEDEGTEIIVVDNMTYIINELFARKEKSDAHTLLTLLSSTLHTLSKTNNILTIIHNSTNPTTTSHTSYPNQNQHQIQNTHPDQRQHNLSTLHAPPTRSIFSSASQKPALGQIFAQFPDLHLFMHALPRGRRDAEVLYGGDSDIFNDDGHDGEEREGGGVRYVTVVEVVKDEAPILGCDRLCGDGDEDGDGGGKGGSGKEGSGKAKRRFAYREQKWTAVDVAGDGMRLVGAFSEKGGTSGLGLSRERGGKDGMEGGLSGGVGNVAKIWGFGGRRV